MAVLRKCQNRSVNFRNEKRNKTEPRALPAQVITYYFHFPQRNLAREKKQPAEIKVDAKCFNKCERAGVCLLIINARLHQKVSITLKKKAFKCESTPISDGTHTFFVEQIERGEN
jgi:hypothetical protein